MFSRKTTLTLTLAVLISATLLLSYAEVDVQCISELSEPIENGSFEDRDENIPGYGVYSCPPWYTNNGGWRELQAEVDGDGDVDWEDYSEFALAYGSHYGDPDYDIRCDFDGDGNVNWIDFGTLATDYGKTANRLDGSHSWYTSGGGEYEMWQWLDGNIVQLLAGETVKFSFDFYPESVEPGGSENNARAEISYTYISASGPKSKTIKGVWVAPTVQDWQNAYVTATLPSTVIEIAVIIRGKPDFKANIDLAELTTLNYNLYYTYPPYDTLDTYPQNGYCIEWVGAKVCVYADESIGLVLAYSWDASSVGAGREAYGQFNRDPVPGNSPVVYEVDSFSIGAYWAAYGYLGPGGASYSCASIIIYLYYATYQGWEQVRSYEMYLDSWDYPNQEVYYSGCLRALISSPPSGSGQYTVVAKARTFAINYDGSAEADFFSYPYYMFIDYIKMSD